MEFGKELTHLIHLVLRDPPHLVVSADTPS
jgi:hypothetical protein